MGAGALGTRPIWGFDRQKTTKYRKVLSWAACQPQDLSCGGVQAKITNMPMCTNTPYTSHMHKHLTHNHTHTMYTLIINNRTHTMHTHHVHHTHITHVSHTYHTHNTNTPWAGIRTQDRESLTRPAQDSAWDDTRQWLDSRSAASKIEWCPISPAPRALIAAVSEANPMI